ncbi:VOC family protein, partial [Schumannella luteola]
FTLMGADTPSHMPLAEGGSISVSLSGDDDAKLRGFWDALLDGGSQTVPLETAPWGDAFGMLVDRFGIAWLVNISAPSA